MSEGSLNRRTKYYRRGSTSAPAIIPTGNVAGSIYSLGDELNARLGIKDLDMAEVAAAIMRIGSTVYTKSFNKACKDADGLRTRLVIWLNSYKQAEGGYEIFKRRWKYARTAIGLQTRLFVEQVLFEMGGEWRNLIGGFGPL